MFAAELSKNACLRPEKFVVTSSPSSSSTASGTAICGRYRRSTRSTWILQSRISSRAPRSAISAFSFLFSSNEGRFKRLGTLKTPREARSLEADLGRPRGARQRGGGPAALRPRQRATLKGTCSALAVNQSSIVRFSKGEMKTRHPRVTEVRLTLLQSSIVRVFEKIEGPIVSLCCSFFLRSPV